MKKDSLQKQTELVKMLHEQRMKVRVMLGAISDPKTKTFIEELKNRIEKIRSDQVEKMDLIDEMDAVGVGKIKEARAICAQILGEFSELNLKKVLDTLEQKIKTEENRLKEISEPDGSSGLGVVKKVLKENK